MERKGFGTLRAFRQQGERNTTSPNSKGERERETLRREKIVSSERERRSCGGDGGLQTVVVAVVESKDGEGQTGMNSTKI